MPCYIPDSQCPGDTSAEVMMWILLIIPFLPVSTHGRYLNLHLKFLSSENWS
jgi:hypothetical protein